MPVTMSRKPTDVASKERNEYIPAFISKKPFYIDDESAASDYLEHQRLQRTNEDQSKWYDRGKRLGPAATKYRKGACENCGAMTHKSKECLSRPRKQGARWTGKDIQADEVTQKVELGWDAKRDRWNGYDTSEYRDVVEEYEELENMKRQEQTKVKPRFKMARTIVTVVDLRKPDMPRSLTWGDSKARRRGIYEFARTPPNTC